MARTSPAEQIVAAKALLDAGTITQGELDKLKGSRSPKHDESWPLQGNGDQALFEDSLGVCVRMGISNGKPDPIR